MASLQAEACKSLVTRMWEPGAVDIASLQRTVDALRVQQESVQQEREQLEAMKAAVDGNIERFKQRVKLNVGGSRFETTLSTLTRHPDSMLAVMFSGRHEVPQDDDGYVLPRWRALPHYPQFSARWCARRACLTESYD